MLVPIEDAADPRLADYVDLTDVAARQRREGDEFFITEGPVAIARLLQSDHHLRSVLVSLPKYERLAPLLDGLPQPVYVAATDVLKATVGFDIHRGAVASADRRPLPALETLLRTARRIAVLEGLNDPENLGAIARSARAFGIDALVLDPTCIDPYYRRTVRVSMGEILFLPVARATHWKDALATIREAGFDMWALTPRRDATDLWTMPIPDRLALLLGAEGPGLSAAAWQAASTDVRIPIVPDVDSLNVAAAAAVAFAAIARGTVDGFRTYCWIVNMKRRSLAAVAAITLVLAACGDDDSESGAAATEPAAEATTAPAATTGAGRGDYGPAETAATTPATDAAGGGDAAAGGTEIVISGFAFSEDITVPVGTTVTVRNDDGAAHTFTADDGSFDSGSIAGGDTFEFTFTEAGTFAFHCNIHPSMTGTITVTA